ncbi:hypothetical protein ACSBR1_002609 [Camellia fascicularis]
MDYSQDAVFLEEETAQTELFNRPCFGRPVVTADNENHWFHLSMEEVFYLYYYLRCLKIVCKDECTKYHKEPWNHMKSERSTFPVSFKAYSYLHMRN